MEKHFCQLPGVEDNYVDDFVDAGLFVNFRRFLKRLLIISMKHPYSKFYATSTKKIRYEQKRHLVNYYYMIHPLSLFRFIFDLIMAFLLLGTFIIAPILNPTLDPDLMQNLFSFKNFMQVVMIIICLFTGYYDVKNNTVTLKWRKAVRKYLKTYFIADLAGILPALIRLLLRKEILDNKLFASRVLAPVMILIMYGRYFYCMNVFNQVQLATGLSSNKYKAIRVVLHVLIFLLLTMFILYFCVNEISSYKNRTALESAEYSLKMLLMINHGFEKYNYKAEELVAPIIVIMLGFILHLLMLISVMELWYKFSSLEKHQTTTYNSISAYMRYKALPISMRNRISLYLNFKFQGHFYKDSIIKQVTSVSLQKEIIIKAAMNSTENVHLFQQLPKIVLEKLRAHLVSEIYLPDDPIIKVGQTGKCMFFIFAGTVKVTTPDGKILCYLSDGAHFGEVALVGNIARVANVIAETPCELFKLSRKSFLEVVEGYPSLMKEMTELATNRLTETSLLNIEEERLSNVSSDEVSVKSSPKERASRFKSIYDDD